MLDGRGVEALADPREVRLALVAVVRMHAHLDQFVRAERDIDLVQHRGGKPRVADRDDRME